MSTLANITSLNLSLQTGGAALAVKAVKSVAKPERVVYVFGTADDVAPNFTTFANAYFYAASLTPTVTEPVVVRLFTKTDGTPYDLVGDGDDPWLLYAQEYIYVYSDFKRQNVTDVLPTTLPAGLQVWYIDPNGVETLWVGREDGSAWPAVGYKEYVAGLTQAGTNAPVATVLSNTLGTVTLARSNVGQYSFNSSALFTSNKTVVSFAYYLSTIGNSAEEAGAIAFFQQDLSLIEFNTIDPSFVNTDGILLNQVTIRVYP
jgi:hypothetical protein